MATRIVLDQPVEFWTTGDRRTASDLVLITVEIKPEVFFAGTELGRYNQIMVDGTVARIVSVDWYQPARAIAVVPRDAIKPDTVVWLGPKLDTFLLDAEEIRQDLARVREQGVGRPLNPDHIQSLPVRRLRSLKDLAGDVMDLRRH